jgi:hypothetical protein
MATPPVSTLLPVNNQGQGSDLMSNPTPQQVAAMQGHQWLANAVNATLPVFDQGEGPGLGSPLTPQQMEAMQRQQRLAAAVQGTQPDGYRERGRVRRGPTNQGARRQQPYSRDNRRGQGRRR